MQNTGADRHVISQSQSFSGKINACGSSFPGSSEDVNVITRGSIGLAEGTGSKCISEVQTEDQSRDTGE